MIIQPRFQKTIYINVGGKNLKRLTFRITDDKSNTQPI